MEDRALIDEARKHVGRFALSTPDLVAAEVSAVVLTSAGNLYAGVSVHLACGVGFCAEHSAVAAMLLHRETVVRKVVAVGGAGDVLPPCGRCRELLAQVDRRNQACVVLLPNGRTKTLAELLPDYWLTKWDS